MKEKYSLMNQSNRKKYAFIQPKTHASAILFFFSRFRFGLINNNNFYLTQ